MDKEMKVTKAQAELLGILSDDQARTIFEIARASTNGFGWVDRTLLSLEERGLVCRIESDGLPKFTLSV